MKEHIPVLLEEAVHYLRPQKGDSYLDVTAGYGGHAQAILEQTESPHKAVLVDRDRQAALALKRRFDKTSVSVVHQDYLNASRRLARRGRRFDMILADLGASSPQFEDPKRGFSFSRGGRLDMRMDNREKVTAAEIVNHSDKTELSRILTDYGEEPRAEEITQAIVKARPIKDTVQLAAIAASYAASPRSGRLHPATRVFQALRIAVNDELNQLEQTLPIWVELLREGGRLVIISFHSLEDRLVKRFLAEHSDKHYDGNMQILTPKPIAASEKQKALNPRARSAKLRAAAKIKTASTNSG